MKKHKYVFEKLRWWSEDWNKNHNKWCNKLNRTLWKRKIEKEMQEVDK